MREAPDPGERFQKGDPFDCGLTRWVIPGALGIHSEQNF